MAVPEEYFKIYDDWATEELIKAYQERDSNVYDPTVFDVIVEILRGRGIDANALATHPVEAEAREESSLKLFLRHLLPAERVHLVFILGTICLLISPFLNWLPIASPLLDIISPLAEPRQSFYTWSLYTLGSKILILLSAFASLILCLLKTQKFFSNFLSAMIPALMGLLIPLNYLFRRVMPLCFRHPARGHNQAACFTAAPAFFRLLYRLNRRRFDFSGSDPSEIKNNRGRISHNF